MWKIVLVNYLRYQNKICMTLKIDCQTFLTDQYPQGELISKRKKNQKNYFGIYGFFMDLAALNIWTILWFPMLFLLVWEFFPSFKLKHHQKMV